MVSLAVLFAGLYCVSGWRATVTPARRSASTSTVMSMLATPISRNAPVPPGPDPYKLVNDELEFIKGSLKKVLTSKGAGTSSALSSNEVLTMAAREFMQRKGKSFRPMLVLLIGRATNPDFVTDQRHSKLAVITEMIHTASLIHNDVLEEHETDTSQGTLVHQEVALDVGNKVCILAGDFLLAKAAVELSLLESSKVTEIVASGLESICEGGMMGFNSTTKGVERANLSVERHLEIISQTIAQLVANACQCAAILSGHEASSRVANACHVYGRSLTMAHHLVGEAEAMERLIKSCRRNAKKACDFSAVQPRSTPFLLAAEKHPRLRELIGGAEETTLSPAEAVRLVERSGAIKQTQLRAEAYAQEAADALVLLPNSVARDSLQLLCHKVVSRTALK
ncbi:hypothetical protein AB1Y20_022588 [Prymnesium parvum]|uniref:Uncharacterized protein n=1 Tax=Prymnesium parvum TaxID=97485 RepID=A0AB34JJ98_PRYPA